MVLTPSKMLPLATKAINFSLLEINSSSKKNLEELRGKNGTVIVFMCNHCPYVIHVLDVLKTVSKQMKEKGIQFIGINSNDVINYPEDSPENMKKQNLPFPYLFDETQEVAKAYQAACTPDFYLFDKNLKLFYRSQFDDSRPGNKVIVTGESLINAINDLLEEKAPPINQKPSMGCNIKWNR